MKLEILNAEGKKVKELNTVLFEEPIREDIIFKVVEAERVKHPNSNKYLAGMTGPASGANSKTRHKWKSDRGKGISRIPRKTMSRRGTQFNWVGAIIPSTRGGRRAHPPKAIFTIKKINKKELIKALLSALTYVSSAKELQKKYASLNNKDINKKLPFVVEDKVLDLKSGEFFESLKKILGEYYGVSLQKKNGRAGRGKSRGRKYKKNAGLLLVIGKNERKNVKGIEVLNADMLTVSDLATNGARLTIFSENAIKDLEALKWDL